MTHHEGSSRTGWSQPIQVGDRKVIVDLWYAKQLFDENYEAKTINHMICAALIREANVQIVYSVGARIDGDLLLSLNELSNYKDPKFGKVDVDIIFDMLAKNLRAKGFTVSKCQKEYKLYARIKNEWYHQ